MIYMWVQPKPKVQEHLKTAKKKGTVSSAIDAKTFAENPVTAGETHIIITSPCLSKIRLCTHPKCGIMFERDSVKPLTLKKCKSI